MKLTLICALLFACGLLAGMRWASIAGKHSPAAVEMHAPGSTDAFAEWQTLTKAKSGGDEASRARLAAQMARLDGFKAWQAIVLARSRPKLADVEALARRWTSRNGREAVEFGLGITDPILRGAFLSVALSRWFGREAETMLAWLRSRPDRQQLVTRITQLEYMDFLPQDAAALGHLAALYEGGPLNAPYSNHVLHVWRHANQREAATAWLRQQPASFERDLAWRSIATEMAHTDPQAAASLAAEVSDESLRRQVTSTAAAFLARRNPADAFAFASSLPEGKDRTTAWQSVLGTWALDDPSAAVDYLRQNTNSITVEMIQPLTRQWSLTQPAELLRVVQNMQGADEARVSIVRNVISEWRRQSSDQARQWLQSHDASWLPEADLKSLQRTVDQPISLGSGGRTVQGRRFWFGG
ncbi:MAG: hypothetical protein HS117_16935 [Verrucomicrobiaceae bacterium]|nr:hypothetical protein [Verrucomicrobiaceae bacterium]